MKTKGHSKTRKVYALLLSTYGRDWRVRLSFVLALISRACKFVALPIAASQLIASLAAQDYARARTMVLIFAVFSAMIGILGPVAKYIGMLGENHTYTIAIREYFWALLCKDVKYFNESMTGYLTSATRHYGDGSIQLVRKLRDSYLSTAFAMTVPIIVIAFVDWQLGLVVLGLSIVQAVYLIWASRKLGPYRTKSRELYKQVSGQISDAITNIIAVKSTAQEKTIAKQVGTNLRQESLLFTQRYRVQSQLVALREVITVTFFLTLFWITVSRMSSGSIDVASAVLVITYSFTILTAIYELSDSLDEHDDLIDRIIPAIELLEDVNIVRDPDHPKRLGRVNGAIELADVSFAYAEGKSLIPVFNNLSLQIPAGQKLGIVGLSGAGKSTFAKLLLRFEDVQGGTITVDGTAISQVTQADLRRNIAYVPQEPLLFHSSIAENVRLAKLDASETEVNQALKSAHAQRFIEALPGGIDSVAGERGVKLSGGQKQRIAIARAVLQDAPIIILDEATSALDSESEQIIKESFSKILKDKTAIVIAHRLSTLADMDRIVLLHEGKIIEDGSHNQLLQKKGVYAKLWKRQRLHPEDLETPDAELELLKNN